jgi:nucleotide-binding universal stress UspA family protein
MSAAGATRARTRSRLNATRSLQRPVGGDGRVIVVGYDATPQARAALAFAARRAGRQGTVVAVHAVAPAHGYLGQPYYNRAVERAQLRGRAILDDLPATGGSAVETALLEGRPAEVLARVARVRDAREIVVGSRRLGRSAGCSPAACPGSHRLPHALAGHDRR